MITKNNLLRKLTILGLILFISCDKDSSNDNPQSPNNPNGNSKCSGGAVSISIGFSNQSDLEAFAAKGYTEVDGTIGIYDGVYDLSSLSCLQKVTGLDLRSKDLKNFKGLENLTNVDLLYIVGCTNIINFDGLSSLKKIDEFYVQGNESLINFESLNSLESLAYMSVSQNNNLANLNGLEKLTTTPKYRSTGFKSEGEIIISNNPVLTSISGMQNITGNMIELSLNTNPMLTDLGNFSKVTTLASAVIYYCPSLISFNCFPNLAEMFALIISDCDNIQSLELPSIQKMGFFEIMNNPKFNSLIGLSTLNELYYASTDGTGVSIVINNVPSLVSLNGLENLTSNGDRININTSGLGSLSNVCALKKLVAAYLSQGNNIPYPNHISIKTTCSAGTPLLLNFDNLCNCN